MKNSINLTILALILLSLFACRKDIDETSVSKTGPEDPIITIIDYTPEKIDVTASLFGIVTNENGQPEEGAIVRLENNTTTTDEKGRFVFSNITMNKAGTFLTINKTGFFEGSDRFFPEEGSTNYTEIVLLNQTLIANFSSNEGGTFVSNQDQIELSFPPNSIVDREGVAYDGEVLLNARWVDPTADNVNEVMPGGLQGLQDGGEGEEAELVALASYGMMAVELTSPSGTPLNLGNDLNAELKFPIPDELLNNAPAEIPLWSFSNEYGVWIKEGSATKEGNYYVGEVSHFSWWNCDYPFPLIELSGTVVNGLDSTAYLYQNVCIEISSSGSVGCISTDNSGFFSGLVPMDESFTLTVSDECGNVVYSNSIGPFSADTDLGLIILPNSNNSFVNITGTVVDCSNNPLTAGWIEVIVGTESFTSYVSDGTYSFSFFNCSGETELIIFSLNAIDSQEGAPATYTISPVMTIPEISACVNPLTQFYSVTVNDSTTVFLNLNGTASGDSLVINANNGSNFSVYLWMEAVTSIGIYDSSYISTSFHNVSSGDSTGGSLTSSCNSSVSPCNFSINITQYGTNSGDLVAGTYSGDIEFNMGPNAVTYFLEAEFQFEQD